MRIYSFSKLKANQLFIKIGDYSTCYIYVVSVGQYANIFKCWIDNDSKIFKDIKFENFSRNYWNFISKSYEKTNKKYNEEIIKIFYIKAIQSIFTYNEYYLKNSNVWGN